MVVTVGLAITFMAEVLLNAVLGNQVYVVAPLALNDTEFPKQMYGLTGLMVMVGLGTTLAKPICV